MLIALHIQNFVLIDQARLVVSNGLTALTGETGAGKSILLGALGLAVGARAERGAIRQGAKQGVVAATFEEHANHPVWQFLEDNGLDTDDDQIILRRVLGADGRGRGFVNDQPVSIGMLRAVGEHLLEIHGQHDGRGFLTAATHRSLLDEFGGLEKKAHSVTSLWREWRDIKDELAEHRRERDSTAREADYLRHVVGILDTLSPKAGEETELASRRAELMASEKIADELNAAAAAIDEGNVESKLSVSLRNIIRAGERLESENEILATAATRLDRALNETMEARAAIAQAIDSFGAAPDELDSVEERLFALRAEARKHGVTPDLLSEFHQKTKTALDNLELGAAIFSDLEQAEAKAKTDLVKAAKELSKNRIAAAKKLDQAVQLELAPLKLGAAHFQTKVDPNFENITSDGVDHVEFMVATNPGAALGPLKTIASGGELSRFVLAMKAALAAKENRTVIIFDEVDAGVGGAVADAVGERLARLAADAQVLVVTHSPQVAARADRHWRIEKKQGTKLTTTNVTMLADHERAEEIARMLSGAKITDEARAAAKRLLSGNDMPSPRKRTRKKA